MFKTTLLYHTLILSYDSYPPLYDLRGEWISYLGGPRINPLTLEGELCTKNTRPTWNKSSPASWACLVQSSSSIQEFPPIAPFVSHRACSGWETPEARSSSAVQVGQLSAEYRTNCIWKKNKTGSGSFFVCLFVLWAAAKFSFHGNLQPHMGTIKESHR